MEILLVDEQSQRELLRLVFLREGYEVFEAGTEEEAWEVIGLQNPNLLIVDMGRHGETWQENLAKQLKEHFPGLPVIITGTDPPFVLKERNQSIGADAFFQKPLNLSEFREKVKELCH